MASSLLRLLQEFHYQVKLFFLMQGTPAMFPSTPSPFFIRRGLDLIPQPLFLSQDKGLLVDYEGIPSPSKFWYGAQSLCPFGARHDLSDYAWLVAFQGTAPSQKHSWTSQAAKPLPHGATCFLGNNPSKTFRTKRSLEEFYFFETSLSL